MAAAFLALVALLQAAPAADGPVSTAPKMPTIRPAQAAAAPSVIGARNAAQPPADDYGYVAWCYGALDTYVGLYDRVMPEVTRIERAFPGPRGADADLRLYPQMRDQAKKDLAAFRTAIVAAERASPRSIGPEGAIAMRKGRAVWSGAANAKTAEVAREWMGWSPPARCAEVAKTLTQKSVVFGQALLANQPQADSPSAFAFEPEPAPAAEPTPPLAPAPRPAPAVAEAPPPAAPTPTPVAAVKPAAKPAVKAATGPKPTLPIGAFIIDPDNPRGCPGRLDPSIKDGRIVMVCLP